MGGSSGGSISTLDLSKITSAANDRIKEAFALERKILFVCGEDDEEYLVGAISRTSTLQSVEYEISSDETEITEDRVVKFNLIVAFVNSSNSHNAINLAIQIGTGQKKTCLFVRNNENSPMPQYVLQYRIRSIDWHALSELLRD